MNTLKEEVLRKWLRIEFFRVANKAKLIFKQELTDEKLVYDTVRCLDHESIIVESPNVNYIITVIGLMWEHTDHNKYDLRQIIIKFLSRIGYPTSAIICDERFDKILCSFGHLNSWIDEVLTTVNQENNEVVICGRKYLLTDFQKKIWNSMDNDNILGISAPTSAGKSFVILLKIIERLSKEDIDVVYIVPTLSLLNQVTEDFNRELKYMGISNYWISNSFEQEQKIDARHIYVLTQEKAIAAFADSEKAFSKRLILVADEIQNIERIKEEKDERSKILFDTLIEFRYKENVEQIIISGPRIEEIDKVGKSIFGIETKDHTTDISPVLNLTYSIKKIGHKFYFKQYCALTNTPIIEEIENIGIIQGYGKKAYTEKYLYYLNNFVRAIGNDDQNIIFAPTSNGARKIAMALSMANTHVEKELVQYYRDTIHDNYSLCDTLLKGVAYHHGKLPMHVRRTLERAISDKQISNVVCTTTLLQGVNLPAQNVFIRNPHLYMKKKADSSDLTNYEMANLRGRAGRLLKDYIGRTFVMDEDEFSDTEGYEQMELFDDVTKELPSGYELCFDEYRNEIEDVLINNKPVDATMKKYGYLISYIRQSVLRYGKDSRKRMNDVGIKLSQKQVAAIILKLGDITVPHKICYQNRYWDPLVLETIYTEFDGQVPTSPYEKGARGKLDSMMRFLRDSDETSSMYIKHIPEKFRNGKMRGIMISLFMKWSQENKLKDILTGDRYEGETGADNIDETIELLQNTISFNIPLLLKPIFDIKNPESCFLTCMQAGACNIISRTMIEMGIARETALYLFDEYFKKVNCSNKNKIDTEDIIRRIIKENYVSMPYWIRVQLDFLI